MLKRKIILSIFSLICAVHIFQVDKVDLLKSIDSLYDAHPQYRCPDKWTIDDSYSMKGQEFSSERRFYFSSPIEEMYYVTILPFGTETKVIISAVHTNTGWHLEKDIPSDEIERIEKTFEDSIVSKLEILTNSKSTREE